jgi:hypothetical protein
MSQFVRAYVVAQALEFVRNRCPAGARGQIEGAISEQLKSTLVGAPLFGWTPRSHLVEVLNAVAAATPPESRHERLVECGSYIGERTTNEFGALAFALLTPELFVKKVPRFWQREHRDGARWELEQSAGSGSARLSLSGVAGYDQIAVVWLGWMSWVVTRMPLGGVSLTQAGWGPAAPGPDAVTYELRWS